MSVLEHILSRNGEVIVLDGAAIESLRATVRGQIIGPADPDYETARRVWNGMIDKHPALIARCTGTADVAATVRFARQHDLLVAVRGGGHNVAGNAVCDGGLVIDLSRMRGVHVDPAKRAVRAQGGVTWGDLDHETQIYGLVTPGGEVSMTGIAGYTLSGGLGLLQRKWGLACDNLLSVEIVTADGEVRRASNTEHPDLFWAVRGGGGNFGVVTWFEYQLYPLGPEVYSATAIYRLEDAATLLRSWSSFTAQAPDEVTSEAIVWSMPPFPDLPMEMHGAPILVLAGLYAGNPEEGEQALAPLREFGEPIVDVSGRSSYVELQSIFDVFFPDDQLYYWKSLNLDKLDEDMIDSIVAWAADRPSPQTAFGLRHLGGAIGQVPDDATAYGNRHAAFNLSLDAIWHDPAENERMVSWVRRAWADLREKTKGGVYLNFAGLGEENDLLARAGYGRNYDRLVEVKRRYDPTNFFRRNINIKP